jgi:DNA-binding PadR family transcriptional regulator
MEEQYLGAFEEIVLLAVCGVEDHPYAVPIQEHIENRAGRRASIGSVYRTLSRLEKKGYLRSRMGEITRERGGKRKRLYEITSLGRSRLVEAHQTRSRLWSDIEPAPTLRLSR